MKSVYAMILCVFFYSLNAQGQLLSELLSTADRMDNRNGTNVCNEPSTVPKLPDSYKVATALPSFIRVGTNQTYTTLTGSSGLFAAINASTINSNTVISIVSDIIEPGTVALNLVKEEGPNAGNLTLTIQSDGSPHLISCTAINSPIPMISINGAKRLIIDGGSPKKLTFRNTNTNLYGNTAGPVIQFDSNSQNDTIRNCYIESNASITSCGAITIGSTGSNSVVIQQDDIRDARGGTIGSPATGIYSVNSIGNNTVTIKDNNIYNQKSADSYGVRIKYIAGCIITGNSFYMENAVGTVGPYTGIYLGYGKNQLVAENYIGGSAPKCGGTIPFTVSGNVLFNGVYCYSTVGATTIQGNTIQNISMTGTDVNAIFYGIHNSMGPITVTGNTIGNATALNSILLSGLGSSVGIYQELAQDYAWSYENNLIANVTLNRSSGSQVFCGMRMKGGIVRKNTIFNIGSSTAITTPAIYGIYNASGLATNEFSNNSISLNAGNATTPTLYGFYEGSKIGTTGFYDNSINLYGTASGTTASCSFYRSVEGTYVFRDNLLVNTRTGGTGIHYAIFSTPKTLFSSDYNDLYVAGLTLGHWGADGTVNDKADINAWRAATTQDVNSISADPVYTTPTNLKPSNNSPVNGMGIPVINVTTDIIETPRNSVAPTIGAYELVCIGPTSGGSIGDDQIVGVSEVPALIKSSASASGYSGLLVYKWQSTVSPFDSWTDIQTSNATTYQPGAITQTTLYKRLAKSTCMESWVGAAESNVVTITVGINKWIGTQNSDWNNPKNWTQNRVPDSDGDVVVDDAPLNQCFLDKDRSVNDITINQPSYRIVTNGKSLTIKGNLNLSGGARIDASYPNSTIIFSGLASQIIPPGAFANDKVYSLIVNNASGVILNSDLSVDSLLTINSGKQLVILTEKLLNVSGTIHNYAGTSGLVLKADESGKVPNGSLIFHNDATQGLSVPGTVEMYSKASRVNGSYRWQFFGIPLKSIVSNPTFDGSYVREMHEDVIGTTGHWVQLQNGSVLTSFTGYEITQADSKMIRFEGDLENADYAPGPLSYTTEATYSGQHLIGNPYMAAINIRNDAIPANSLTFGDGMDKTVYLYNTGSKADWSGNQVTGNNDSDAPGQYLAIPQKNAGADKLPASIPSMQAFLVMVTIPGKDATLSIPYSSTETLVKNTTMQRAKAMEKVYTRVDVTGANYSDRMWIFTDSSCTRDYDNGWDGYKLMGSVLAPQIYAMEAAGDFQVNTIDDINNTILGFKAGIDTAYTLTFTHNNTDTRYKNLYLMDLSANKTIDITASGSQYSFNLNSETPLENRFKIITTSDSTVTSIKEKSSDFPNNPITVFSSKKTILVNNRSHLTGNLYLYDMSGRLLGTLKFNASAITTLPVSLPVGSYLSKAVTLTDEVTTNLIICQ